MYMSLQQEHFQDGVGAMVLNIAVFLGLMRISTYLSLSICLSIYVTIYPSVLLSIYPPLPHLFFQRYFAAATAAPAAAVVSCGRTSV